MIESAYNYRICLVIEPSGGGSGRHVLDLAKGLGARGHDVTVIWSPVRAESHWVRSLESLLNVRNLKLNMLRSVGPHDLLALRKLTKILNENGPFDIIHGHSSKAGALVRLLPRSVSGHRIYTPHAYITMDPSLNQAKRLVYQNIEQILSSRPSTTIAVSADECSHAKKMNVTTGLETVVNGFTRQMKGDRLAARAKMGAEADDFLVGFIGRLAYQKNPQRFVSVVARAQKLTPQIKGIIIGDGELSETVKLQASHHPNIFNFMGWQNALELLPGLDMFLMTSRYEAMPYTLLEATAYGLPIIATRVGGVEETIEQGKNGYIFEQSAPDSLIASKLSGLARSVSTHTSFSKASLELSRSLTVEQMVEQTLNIYARQSYRDDIAAQ